MIACSFTDAQHELCEAILGKMPGADVAPSMVDDQRVVVRTPEPHALVFVQGPGRVRVVRGDVWEQGFTADSTAEAAAEAAESLREMVLKWAMESLLSAGAMRKMLSDGTLPRAEVRDHASGFGHRIVTDAGEGPWAGYGSTSVKEDSSGTRWMSSLDGGNADWPRVVVSAVDASRPVMITPDPDEASQ